MEIKKVNVTPAMAAKWIAGSNDSNRRLAEKTVSKYADDMASGNWRDTHQNAIAFYKCGDLADGQHRLAAVVMSGKSVEMIVATGLDRADGAAIDQGRPRSAADALRLGGLVDSSKYLTAKVAIAKLLRLIETGNQGILSIAGTADILGAISAGVDFAMIHSNSAQPGIGTAPVRAALTTAYYCVPEETAERFARVLVSGMAESPLDVSVIRLRNWLLQNRGSSQRLRNEAYKTVLRVLSAYVDGETLGIIRKTDRLYYKIGIFDGE